MNRREFIGTAIVGAQGSRLSTAPQQSWLYFVDGYHGGVRGHMPPGAWRDIVTRLRSTPAWKLCLDIEAASWVRLAEDDPQTFAELKELLQHSGLSSRVEMVGGTFCQPYGWAMTGESNIRQLVYGLEVIRQSFPGLPVRTYAVQEPCWASCLPQILNSLGFQSAVLKNPSTAWGGYSVGIDAETVNWIGPDGTSIRTVPRYACEELLDTWRTEAETGSKEFMTKCMEHGIAHPAGMCFQDLGWAARPKVHGDYIDFVTWREYMENVASKTTVDWRLGIEGTRCALPWGEKTIQKIARQVRSAENRLIVAEKLASLAAVFCDQPYPHHELRKAWEKTLWAQHHDSWITATTRTGVNAWAFQVASETWDTENVCTEVIDASLDRLVESSKEAGPFNSRRTAVTILNTLAHDRKGFVEIVIPTPPGTRSLNIRDSSGAIIPSQVQIAREYVSDSKDRVRGNARMGVLAPGESIGAGRLQFLASVPSMGAAAYLVEISPEAAAKTPAAGTSATTETDGTITVESDLYRIRFDPARGGIIRNLFTKQLNKELCKEGDRSFHELRGYFIEEKRWESSADRAATLEIVESGPVRVTLTISGFVGPVPFTSNISVTQGQPRIEFQTQLRFAKDTWIGDPWEIKPEDRMKGRRRSEYDDRFKLLVNFPVAIPNSRIDKNAAFDVCRSENIDTFFQTWDTIKHNIIVNWVDQIGEASDLGLALFSDHTTSYAHGENDPLSLVAAWGWDGGYWWGKCPLNGIQELRYAVMPHAGNWKQARLWSQTAEWAEPLLARLSVPADKGLHQPLVRPMSKDLQLSSAIVSGRDLLLRFFNAEGADQDHEIAFGLPLRQVEMVELNGAMRRRLKLRTSAAGIQSVLVTIPPFGFTTLRLVGVVSD